jgi:2-oxoglutarate ferredoxin oxidoreductase subunit alpha
MRLSILFGGPAGAGPNILTNILGNALVNLGYFVFYSRDYQSLIRGGHNFNVLTFSDCSCSSNDSSIDILVALDSNTISVHKKQLVKKGIILGNSEHPNMYYAGKLFKTLGLDFTLLEKELKKLEKRLNENMIEAKLGYEEGIIQFNLNLKNKNKFYFANGNSV